MSSTNVIYDQISRIISCQRSAAYLYTGRSLLFGRQRKDFRIQAGNYLSKRLGGYPGICMPEAVLLFGLQRSPYSASIKKLWRKKDGTDECLNS